MNVTTTEQALLETLDEYPTIFGANLRTTRRLVKKGLVRLVDTHATLTTAGMEVLYPTEWMVASTYSNAGVTVQVKVADGEEFFIVVFNGDAHRVSYDDAVADYIGESAERAYDWLI